MVNEMMDGRYKKGWENVHRDCELCHMTKKTEWYIETTNFIIAEKLGGGPFIVSKRHEKSLSEGRRQKAERLVSLLFDEFELVTRMNIVSEHWHSHIITTEEDTALPTE